MELEKAEGLLKWLKTQKLNFKKMIKKDDHYIIFIDSFIVVINKQINELEKEIKDAKYLKESKISMKFLVAKIKEYIKKIL